MLLSEQWTINNQTIKKHSRPQSPRSFWPVTGIESSGRTRFSEYAQGIRFVFSTNRFYGFDGKSVNRGLPVLVKARARQSSRSLPQAGRIVGSRDENDKKEFRRFRAEYAADS